MTHFPNGTVDHDDLELEARSKQPGRRWSRWEPCTVDEASALGALFVHGARVQYITLTLASGRVREYRRP